MRKLALLAAALSIGASGVTLARADEAVNGSRADEPVNGSRADEALPEIHLEKPTGASSSLDQLITFQAGELHAENLHLSNGAYGFDYSGAAALYGEAGWAMRALRARFGAIYFAGNLGFTSFSGNAAPGSVGADGQPLSSSYSLYVFALDARMMYAADWLPVRWLVPFADAGYQMNFYFQPGSTGEQSVEGSSGFPVAGAGLRLWLNPTTSLGVAGMPIFLSLKYNRLFASASSLQLAENSFLGGVSLGL